MENGDGERWVHLRRLTDRPSRFAQPNFEPGIENLQRVHECRILVVGAGGLGCELLKNLALSGFQHIHVIDMDTIDLSNLNRQFLFREADIGKYKADIAANFINTRVPGCNVVPHHCMIQEKDDNFYRSFAIIICGLDSIQARRWLNDMVVSIIELDDEGKPDFSTLVPMIDGGTEGFKGNARLILPYMTPCIECTLDLYPPQVNFPLCTIAHTPRLPEHCVEYVKVLQWERDKPFGEEDLDGDNTEHVQWVCNEAKRRAEQFGINGVDLRLTLGVLKRIIPAVASTNAVIAASCALEALKLASNISTYMDNYLNFTDIDGVYFGVVSMERNPNCIVCNRQIQNWPIKASITLKLLLEQVVEKYQLKSPSITSAARTLYMMSEMIPALKKRSIENLPRTLEDLELRNGDELAITDVTLKQAITIRLRFESL